VVIIMTTKLVLGFASALIAIALYSGCKAHNGEVNVKPDSTAAVAPAQDYYTCTMHPFVHADKPGACPVCGMDLVKQSSITSSSSDTSAFSDVRFSAAQRVMANISTVAARMNTWHPVINAVGVVDFDERRQSVISARMRGRVDSLQELCCGLSVRAGQNLFSIYSPELLSAMREYLMALGVVERGDGDPSSAQLRDAGRERLQQHYGLSDARIAELERTKQATALVSVTAPIAGTIIKKNFVGGQYVNEGTTLLEIADLSHVWVYLDVYERDLHLVHVGSRVLLTADAYPGAVYRGEVEFIENEIQPATRTVRVRVGLDNPGMKLKTQMFMRGTIETGSHNAITVPSSAVMTTGRNAIVWVEKEQNVFEPRVVTIGGRMDNEMEILTGLKEGEIVAQTGGFLIDSESQLSGGQK
jgi:Cu(I)/Ag(I) efflux system membrane fusion protein